MSGDAIGAPFRRPCSYGPEYEHHASPEAIEAHMADARQRQEEIQNELGWLEGVYLRRVAEKAAGLWPVSVAEQALRDADAMFERAFGRKP